MNTVNHELSGMLEYPVSMLDFCQDDFSGEQLLFELAEFLKPRGVAHISYSAVFQHSQKAGSGHVKSNIPEPIFSTLDQDTWLAYLRGPGKMDSVWQQLSSDSGPICISHSSAYASHQDRVSLFWSLLKLSGRILIPVKSRHDDYWFKFFVLYLDQNTKDTEGWLETEREWLLPLLQRSHQLMSLDESKVTNPYLKLDVLSDTCRKIMVMTAQGYSVKLIADKVGLSAEGVTYHITRVKRLFQAQNKTQLIAALCRSNVI